MDITDIILALVGCVLFWYIVVKFIGGFVFNVIIEHIWGIIISAIVGGIIQYFAPEYIGISSLFGIYLFAYPIGLFFIYAMIRNILGYDDFYSSGGVHTGSTDDHGDLYDYTGYSSTNKPDYDDLARNRPRGYCIFLKHGICRSKDCSTFGYKCEYGDTGRGCSNYESDYEYYS